MEIKNNIFYVGVNDHQVDYFEGQFVVPDGMAYNSYVIIDEQIAVMDTVDSNFADEWLSNVKGVLGEKQPNYLIIQHMEPDHSACIDKFLAVYPNAVLVGNNKTFLMIDNFFRGLAYNKKVVNEGEILSLGGRELTFAFAPMVHWPEVMLTYDKQNKVLFSADAFGKFGALDVDDEWDCEARRYYFGIVGKYGVQVQSALKKLAGVEIEVICPLHGPILKEDLGHYLNLYNVWSSYGVETKGVVIAYTSVYGNTKKAALILAEKLKELGEERVVLTDLVRDDIYEAVEDAFRHDRLVLATTTYNGGIFPKMKEYIDHLTERNFQNKTIAIMENGSWAPMCVKPILAMFEKSKNLNVLTESVKILSSVSDQNLVEIEALAKALVK